ncbi:hypothetical protein FQN54_001648 [Arachnomyces sp. PD_36]|nr:hypothetical protein FQN54_001648 [Arachnomyces sp. PD_36]
MSVEPTEENIENFISFTSSSRKEAIDFLKKNNLDTERAINAYFEKSATPYIESLAGQEGAAYGYQNQDVPSFNIEDSDSPRNNEYKAPPSRPPSRLNNRSTTSFARSGETSDSGAGNTSANTGQGLSVAEQEEEELRQAMAMSLNQDLAGQETGVTEAANTQLSRANRDHYDEAAWAMTLFSAAPQEVIISPDPEDRKRVNGEPTFIRPSEQYPQLGALITILHAIPIAREALLLRDKVLPSYGHDSQWWNGQSINLPKIVSLGDSSNDQDDSWEDLLYEAQRLMAFLDSSERAFGSADALSSITYNNASCTDENRGAAEFMEIWEISAVSATPNNQLATIFSSLAVKGPVSGLDDGAQYQKKFVTFDAEISEGGLTLYEALDATLWPDIEGEFDDVWFDRIGEVFTIKLTCPYGEKSVDVKVPAVWYPDRYFDSRKDTMLEIRKRKVETLKEISRLDALKNRFTTSWAGAKFQVDNIKTLELAADCAEITLKGRSAGASGDDTTPTVPEGLDNIANILRETSKRIEAKLQELEKRKQEAQETFRKHSKILTEQASPTEPPYNKYTLRGVSTLPHVTYVLKRVPDESPAGPGSDGEKTNEWQWWRISFSTEDAKARLAEETQAAAVPSSQSEPAPEKVKKRREIPRNAEVVGYTARKVREIEVLKAAREESSTVLLVYANENAVNFKESGLPPELQEFVDADNKSFHDEIEGIDQASSNDDVEPEPPSLDTWMDWSGPAGGPQHSDTRDRKPSEPQHPSKINVYDYEVSSFPDDQEPTNGGGQEMQERSERRGSAFLGQATTQGGIVSHHSMDQIPEETDEDEKGVNHVEHVN